MSQGAAEVQRCSVVIPAYNCAGFLAEAIDSALAQTLVPHEVIVVDDGSTDDTPSVLASYAHRIKTVRQANAGVSATRNHGASLATGDLVAFLDADDAWYPEKLRKQAQLFASDGTIGLVHCGMDEVDDAGRLLQRRLDGLAGWVLEEMLLFRRAVVLGAGSTAMLPRELFQELGGFDERLSTSADWDLCYRVARRHSIGFVPESLVKYRIRRASMHFNIRVMERDMLLAYAKAFGEATPAIQRLRRPAYGALHAVLAGSFFQARQYGPFLSHAGKSLLHTPSIALRFAAFPVRALRRRWVGRSRLR